MKKDLTASISKMAFSALFTAVIAIAAQIMILTPSGVPFSLQTFAVALCGYILGAKWSSAAVGAYILLGAVGLPVFSGFRGGIHNLLSITGGFIFGFLSLSLFCGISKRFEKAYIKILFGLIGLLLCHICGVLQLALISGSGPTEAFIAASLPFILKDVLLVFAAFYISKNKAISRYDKAR